MTARQRIARLEAAVVAPEDKPTDLQTLVRALKGLTDAELARLEEIAVLGDGCSNEEAVELRALLELAYARLVRP